MYNFGELCDNVAVLSQHTGDDDYRNKIKIWLNLGQSFAFYAYDFWSELQAIHQFQSANTFEKVFLPSNFDKPTRLWDMTHNTKITWITREEYVDANTASVATQVTGQPSQASLYGISAVAYEATGPFMVQVKSSSASDNGTIVCRIEGWLDSAKTILGHEDIDISTSSPTTYVPGVGTYYGITRFVKSADTLGYVTLATTDTIPNILASISPYDRQSRYPVLYLGLIPNGTFNYQIALKKRMHKMVNDNDYPFAELDEFLNCYATGFAFTQEKESESRAKQMFDKADGFLNTAIRNENNKMGTGFQFKMIPTMAQAMRR